MGTARNRGKKIGGLPQARQGFFPRTRVHMLLHLCEILRGLRFPFPCEIPPGLQWRQWRRNKRTKQSRRHGYSLTQQFNPYHSWKSLTFDGSCPSVVPSRPRTRQRDGSRRRASCTPTRAGGRDARARGGQREGTQKGLGHSRPRC